MTDRTHRLIVTLDMDRRVDDAEPLIEAIKQMRGVVDVRAEVSTTEREMALMRARIEVRQQVSRVLWPEVHRDE